MTLKKLRALESGPPQVKGIFKHAQQTFKTMLTMLCMFRLKIGQLTIAVSTVDRKMAIKYNPLAYAISAICVEYIRWLIECSRPKGFSDNKKGSVWLGNAICFFVCCETRHNGLTIDRWTAMTSWPD